MLTCAITGLAMFLAAVAQDAKQAKKPGPAAKITLTAPLACLHCTFGEGDTCAVCLKLDDKTPIILTGKAVKPFEDERLNGKPVVVAGVLTRNKDKWLELAAESVRAAAAKDVGQTRIEGHACCAKCDLGLFEQCTMAVKNAAVPVVLIGKLADQHAGEGAEPRPVAVTGRLVLDKAGIIRIEATKVEDVKK